MKVKICDSIFDDCEEIVLIYWMEIDELKVYVRKNDVEVNYPYTHKVALSYLENLEVILEEYPDYISFVENNKSVKIEDFSIKDKNFIAMINNGLTKLYFSSLPYNLLTDFFPEIKRMVTKGVRIDVT